MREHSPTEKSSTQATLVEALSLWELEAGKWLFAGMRLDYSWIWEQKWKFCVLPLQLTEAEEWAQFLPTQTSFSQSKE